MAEAAFQALKDILIGDSFAPTTSEPRPGQLQLSIQKCGPFLAGLQQPNDELDCLAIGSIRKDLFHEIAWQNIISSEKTSTKITPYEMTSSRLLLSISGITFEIRYCTLSSPPSTITAEIQHWGKVSKFVKLNPCFEEAYHFLIEWAKERGIFGFWDAVDERDISRVLMEAFENPGGHFADCRCEDCVEGSGRKGSVGSVEEIGFREGVCAFLHRLSWMEVFHTYREWSPVVRAEALNLLNRIYAKKEEPIALPKQDPISIMNCDNYIKISVQYHGNSQIDCGVALKKVEADLRALVKRLKHIQTATFRLWPQPLLDQDMETSKTPTLPFEAFYLIGFSALYNIKTALTSASLIIQNWKHSDAKNENLFVYTELLTPQDFSEGKRLDVKTCETVWPGRVVVPSNDLKRKLLPQLEGEKEEESKETDSKEQQHSKKSSKQSHPSSSSSHHEEDANKKEEGEERGTENKKLRPALDILHRLRHDSAYNIDEYVIGYLDRHSGIEERDARDWVTDSMLEEWVPQHKILYFGRRRDGGGKKVEKLEKVWDREGRVDLVFR